MEVRTATLDQDRSTATAREFDLYARVLIYTIPSQRETVCVIRWHGKDYFGVDAVDLLRRYSNVLVRLRPFLDLALEYRDIWDCLGKDVVVSDPEKLRRVESFAAKGRRLKVRHV